MKIGILTYHSTHNCGAFLQAYALCHALRDNTGNDVEIINYSMIKAEQMNKQIANSSKRNIKKHLYLQKRYSIFEESIKRFQPITGCGYTSVFLQELTGLFTNGICRYSICYPGYALTLRNIPISKSFYFQE